MKKNVGICSFPVRVICETLLILLLFAPFFLFVSKWPNVENMIHGKVLQVNKFNTKQKIILDFYI
jgi:hypothetical protein